MVDDQPAPDAGSSRDDAAGPAELDDPRADGTGRWPHKYFRAVEPAWLGDMLKDPQDAVRHLREQRGNRDEDQQQAAKRIGVSLNTLAAVERGEWVSLKTALARSPAAARGCARPSRVRRRRRTREAGDE